MRLASYLFSAFILTIAACGGGSVKTSAADSSSLPDGSTIPTGASDGGTIPAGPSDSGTSQNGALKIVQLSTTMTSITAGDEVSFLAIVTNAAGLDEIAGGTLLDETNATYGGFNAGATKGTYQLTLSWGQINAIRAIQFVRPGSMRPFTAKFFNNQGDLATASVVLSFYCGANQSLDACGGQCIDLQNTGDNCGQCGRDCNALAKSKDPYLLRSGCEKSVCKFQASPSSVREDCSDRCSALGASCVSWFVDGYETYGSSYYALYSLDVADCSTVPPSTLLRAGVSYGFTDVDCMCSP